MKPRTNLLAAITMMGLGSLAMGCYAETGYVVTNDAYAYDYAEPTLVAAGPQVWIVSGQPSTVYYADNYYWMYSGNGWYRSSYYNGGWASVNVNVPSAVSYHYSSRSGGSYTPARPHVAHQASHPRVYTGQTHVGTHVNHSSSGPSVRSGGHVSSSPSFKSSGGHSVHHSVSSHSHHR